ncbi:kelch domain-containing protein 1-like [Salvelinus fontinalis]|uniref:kelch domain-containing protein 1-like n=1 Tax=Salvelinus fontinalis TaxID=8038 RepID=UPI002486022D|nr:kelch domain-containing protein 1-like [Salvelinus fontinalis]
MESAVEKQHCVELIALERSGHTAVVEGNTLHVWGGYMSTAEREVFLPSEEIWLYDLERGVWEMCQMSGEVPPPMSGTCSCFLNGHMYIFGGYDDTGQTNQLYRVNFLDRDYIWKKVKAERGSPPSPRDKLCCWVFNNRVTYFGGYGHKTLDDITDDKSFIVDTASLEQNVGWGWNNEVHVFETTLASWREPQTSGRAPAPRAAHAGATLGHKGYVYGGRVLGTTPSDIHCLDLESWIWSEIVPTSTVPGGRSWHSLTAVSDNTLFLFGGLNVDCKPMSDGWVLDVDTKTWRELDHPNNNKPRLWHTASQAKDSDVVVFGGSCDYVLLGGTYENLTGHSNDALVFQTQPYPLFRICVDCIAKNLNNCKMLQIQLPYLPRKLLEAVQRRTSRNI